MKTANFIKVCSVILLIPVAMSGLIILGHIVFAQQQTSPTPTVPTIPPQVSTSPNPNLQFIPQKAYIVTTPDGQIQAVPIQENNSNNNNMNGEIAGVIGILSGIATGVWAKMSGSKDVKETNAAVLQNKEVQKELARVMFNFQPEQSKALSDAPAIKLDTLEKQKTDFAEKVAKS